MRIETEPAVETKKKKKKKKTKEKRRANWKLKLALNVDWEWDGMGCQWGGAWTSYIPGLFFKMAMAELPTIHYSLFT